MNRAAADPRNNVPWRRCGSNSRLFQRPLAFEVVVERGLPTITTLRTPLEQCLRNIIGNAVRHHDRDDGRVVIGCRDAGTHVEFVVVDNGPGIAPRHHKRVFEMFQTLRPREDGEGSGMGLALVRKIAESHGGEISLQSEEGRGAAFTLKWPKTIQGPGDDA